MGVVSAGTGTQTAVIDTEHTLDTESTAGVYTLCVDTKNMVAGDIVVLRIKTKFAAGGTSGIAFEATYANVQAEPLKYSPPVPIITEIVCTLEQTDGVGRDFPWNLLRI